MGRRFNITGSCNPQRHYMVKLDDRLKRIKEDYVEEGSYFVINRGRQYGKTTTLRDLEEYLKADYIVLSLDFQEVSTGNFETGAIFSQAFAKKCPKLLTIQRQQTGKKCRKCYWISERTIRTVNWTSCLSV